MASETDAAQFKKGRTLAPRNYKYEVNDELFEVNKKVFEKFSEREHYATDKFEYPRNGKDPGLVLIFNQENFEELRPRKASRRDVNEIVLCLQRQGFNIEESNIMNDGTKEQILQKLIEVSKMDLLDRNCLIIFFLTHGDEHDRLHTSDGSISTTEIWNNFTNCESLRNKPKMFVFQACKGEYHSTTMAPNTARDLEPSKIVSYQMLSPNYMGHDMLVVYSTIEGNVSFRNPLTGSWFIQELCKNFTAYGKRDDVVSLIIRTTKCVSNNYFHHDEDIDQQMKQMPMFMSTLTKKFYLNRNKDRALLLKILDENEQILSMLKIINEKVDKVFKMEEKRKK